MIRLANQRGVAMVTVLFVGMVMTVVVTSAAFVTVREIRSGTDDQRGGKAHAYAEAGIDRMFQWLRSSSTGWRNITLSGCRYTGTTPTASTQVSFTGQLGTDNELGTYTVTLAPADPSNSYCAAATAPIDTDTPPPIDVPYEMELTSTGTFRTSTKTLRQTVELTVEDFPLGMSGSTIDANGNATIRNMSLVVNSTVQGRNKIDMQGADFFYTKSDFYPTLTGATAAQAMPASIHTTDKIYVSGGRQEHPPSCNTGADKVGTDSTWDGSSTGSTITTCGVSPFPPTSKFTASDFSRVVGSGAPPRLSPDDHLFFREVARERGIYCSVTVGTSASCSRRGSTPAPNVTATTGGVVTVPTTAITAAPSMCATTPCFIVSYIEFVGGNPLTNTVNWNAATPNTCTQGMVVLIIKNGSISFGGGARYSGAIFAEDGRVRTVGGPYIEGSVTAKGYELRGNPTYAMTNCWLQNLPGPFIKVTALRWSESDR